MKKYQLNIFSKKGAIWICLAVWLIFFPGAYFLGRHIPRLEHFSVSFYSFVFRTDLCQKEAYLNAVAKTRRHKITWPNCVDKYEGWTPLHYAVHEDNVILVKELMDRGVKIKLSKNGDSALNMVRSKEMAVLLLRIKDAKKFLNHRNKFGWTPLFFPTGTDAKKNVDIFIKSGADPLIKAKNGLSVWAVHAVAGNLDVVQYFYENGYDMYAVVKNKRIHVCNFFPSLSRGKNRREFCMKSKKKASVPLEKSIRAPQPKTEPKK